MHKVDELAVNNTFIHQYKRRLCDVTLSVYPHRAGLKNMPGHGGIRTYDLWNTSPMLCQLSYAVRLVGRALVTLAEHWASIPKVVGSNPTVARHIFQACPVWIYTQVNKMLV